MACVFQKAYLSTLTRVVVVVGELLSESLVPLIKSAQLLLFVSPNDSPYLVGSADLIGQLDICLSYLSSFKFPVDT